MERHRSTSERRKGWLPTVTVRPLHSPGLLTNWIAERPRRQLPAVGARVCLCAGAVGQGDRLFADAEIYNLDARQTLISLMDAIRAMPSPI